MAGNASMTNDIRKLGEEISEQVQNMFIQESAKKTSENIAKTVSFKKIQSAIENAKKIIAKEEIKAKDNEDILKSIYKLVFMLRQVFTNVEYSFQIGIDATHNSTKFLLEYKISQNKLFEDMSNNFQISTSGDLKLASELENQSKVIGTGSDKLAKKEDYFEKDQSDLSLHWQKLMNSLALPERFDKNQLQFDIEEKDRVKTKYSRLSKRRKNGVFLYHRFSRKKGVTNGRLTRSFYFSDKDQVDEKGHIKKIYFNEGWLYEWGKAFEASGGFDTEGKVSIENILQGQHMDNLRGYLYGDYYESIDDNHSKFEAVQAKKNNSKIMSFKDLSKTLDKLSQLMTELSTKTTEDEIGEIIRKYFGIEDGNKGFEKGVSEFVNNSIDQAAKNLKDIFKE